MSNLIVLKHSIAAALILFTTSLVFSQSHYKESFNVGDDAVVSVNTSYTDVIFETWNKNKVEVEAYIDSDELSAKEKKEIFDNWNFNVMGNSKKIEISSNSGMEWSGMEPFSNMDIVMPDMDFLGPLMNEMIMPMISEFTMPPLPDNMGMGDVQFDYEAFKKDEKGYMKKFEAQMEKTYGKDYEKKMEVWGDAFAKKFEKQIGPEWESKMEAWGEDFGKKMEAWGESYGKEMEKRADEWAKKYEDNGSNITKKVITSPNGNSKTIIIKSEKSGALKSVKAKKVIIIRMPKNTKSEINVRHGEIKMADAINVRATLNYSPFTANSIDGGRTLINASYAPVTVNNWKYGTLYLKFVDECKISNAESINLQANSSNVLVGNITDEAILSGSFGNLKIDHISDSFKTVDILLENTDATVKMPSSSFSFYFNGKKSSFKHPKSLQLTETNNYDRVLAKGFNISNNPERSFTINATYSNVKIQ